jgi:hypothetical protein
MPRQQHDKRYPHPLTAVFNALIQVLGKRRWGAPLELDNREAPLTAGHRYLYRGDSVLRRGRVLEVLRPVSLTLYETLYDPPCRVRLQLRWRLYPLDAGSLLRLLLTYQLNGAATLRHRHWQERLQSHCARMLDFVGAELESPRRTITGRLEPDFGKRDLPHEED